MILYKYLPPERALNFIDEPTIFFSHTQLLNDPFELASEANRAYEEAPEGLLNKLTARNARLDRYYLFCLSRCYKNILMWSHYAGSHKGIVVGLDVDALDLNNKGFAVPAEKGVVSYSEELPSVDAEFTKRLLTKSIDWEYENEVRVVGEEEFMLRRGRKKGEGFVVSVPAAAIKEIYLGVNSAISLRGECYSRKSVVSIFQAKQDFRSFKLKFDQVG